MKTVWKYIKILLKIVGVLFIGALIYFSPNIYHIYKWNPVFTPLSAYFHRGGDTPVEERLNDIAFMRKLITIDRSFSPAAIEAFNQTMDELETSAGQLSEADFGLKLAQAAAFADNGHTNIVGRDFFYKFDKLPLRFYWFEGDLHIVRAAPEYAHLVGGKVISLGGTSTQNALQIVSQYTGGPDNWRQYLSTYILESPTLLQTSGIIDQNTEIPVSVQLEDGSVVSVDVMPLPAPTGVQRRFYPWHMLSDLPMPGEAEDWVRAAASWDQPIKYLSQPGTHFHLEEIKESNAVHIQLSFTLTIDGQDIGTFWDEVNTLIAGKKYDYILLDLRTNPGGDFNTSVGHAANLPNHLTDNGKLYVATTNATFSAALVTTSVAKYHGGHKTVIIGTRLGDRDQFWAEGGFPFRLPNSGYRFSFATGYHDWVNGCTGRHPLCFDGNEGIENPISSLDPDILVPLTYEDYKAGIDPVIRKIRELQTVR